MLGWTKFPNDKRVDGLRTRTVFHGGIRLNAIRHTGTGVHVLDLAHWGPSEVTVELSAIIDPVPSPGKSSRTVTGLTYPGLPINVRWDWGPENLPTGSKIRDRELAFHLAANVANCGPGRRHKVVITGRFVPVWPDGGAFEDEIILGITCRP